MGITKEQQREKIRNNRKSKDQIVKDENRISKKHQMRYTTKYILVRGIYFLYHKNILVYIGQSKSNVMQRICDHQKDKNKIFDSFNFLDKTEFSDKQLDEFERKLIKRHNPEYNKVHNQTFS